MSARERAPPTRPSRRTPQRRRRNPRQNKTRTLGAAGASSPEPARATPAAPATAKPDSAPARETLRVGARVLAAYWNEKREFEGFWLATVKRIDHGEFTLEWFDAPGISGVQEPAPGHRRSASRVPRLGQVTRGKASCANSMGRPAGRPSSFRARPEARRAPIPTPNLRRPSHDQHHRVHRRTHPRPQRRLPPHLCRRRWS